MERLDKLISIATSVAQDEGSEIAIDEAALEEAIRRKEGSRAGLAIKVLTIFGGFLATVSFIAFCIAAGLYDSAEGLLIFGGVFLVVSILLNRFYDKLIIDTGSVTMYVSGLALAGWGIGAMDWDLNLIPTLYIMVGVIFIVLVRSFILTFLSILVINGSIVTLILSNNYYDLIHLYIAICTAALTYVFLNEGKALSAGGRLSELYNPLRIGAVFSLIFGLIILGKRGFIPISENLVWLSSVVIIPVILFLLVRILKLLSIGSTASKTVVLSICSLILLTTVFSPAISGAILILLLSFMVNYRTGMAVGVVSLIYFISQYYYDLNFSLLIKSIMLMSSGVLFLILYYFTSKKNNADE